MVLKFSASGKKHKLFLSYPVEGILLQQPKQIKKAGLHLSSHPVSCGFLLQLSSPRAFFPGHSFHLRTGFSEPGLCHSPSPLVPPSGYAGPGLDLDLNQRLSSAVVGLGFCLNQYAGIICTTTATPARTSPSRDACSVLLGHVPYAQGPGCWLRTW